MVNTMKMIPQQIRTNRVFSEDFKKQRVKDYESGKFTIKELGSIYYVNPAVIYRWIYKYSTFQKKKIRIIEMSESSTKKVKDLQARIKELERIIGQKQINIDYLEKIIELAKDELGVDIKKNSDTLQSSGSVKTSHK
jgi:transposase